MAGRNVLVTGGTGGIGRATATGLAELGARVGITGRDLTRTDAAAADIRAATGNPQVDAFAADVSSQAEVRRLAAAVLAAYPHLDVLVNNVGGYWAHRHTTVDGLEHTFAVNHLAPFLLTNLLLDRLAASAPARVVTVSSGAHAMGRIDFEDLQGERGYSRPAGLHPVEAGERAVHLRAGPTTGRDRGHRHRAAPRRGPHRLRRRGHAGDAVRRAAARPAVHEEPRPRSGDLGLPGLLRRGGGRDRSVLRQQQTQEEQRPGSHDTATAARLWQVSAELVGLDPPPQERITMRLGVHLVNFAFPGGPAEIGPTVARVGAVAEEAGVANLSCMDHYLQMVAWASAGSTRRCWRATPPSASSPAHTSTVELQLLVTGVTYRHPGLLAKIVSTLDVLSGGRAVLGIGAAWYEREHRGLRRALPAAEGAVRAAGGDAADRAPDVGTRRRPVRRAALPAGRDDQLPAAAHPAAPADHDRRQPGSRRRCAWSRSTPTPATSSPGRRPDPSRSRPSSTSCAEHCRREDSDFDRIRKTILWVGPLVPDAAGGAAFAETMRGYAAIGIEEVHVMPFGPDPVGFVTDLGEHVIPRLARIEP